MDMDMGSMDSEATPPNMNAPYANTLAGLLAGFILLLTIRCWFLVAWRRRNPSTWVGSCFTRLDPIIRSYCSAERRVINACSYTVCAGRQPLLPPLGALLIAISLISAVLPLLLVQTDLKVNSNRAGFLALSIVPFLLASTGKNSAVSLLTGISSVRLNWLHRLLGTALILLTTVHMACMLYAWGKFPSFLQSQLELNKVHYGLVGYGSLCVVVLGSIYPVRKYAHEVFLGTHLLAFVFLGAIAKHTPYALRYFFAGLFCYVLNALAGWFVKSYLARARIEILPERCTRLTLRLSSPMVHHPGQHIYVCLPSISKIEWHPFTITSTQVDKEGACDTRVEVHACVRGNFTRKLYNTVYPDKELVAFVAGPCGIAHDHLKSATMLRNEAVAIVTAGAGITFGMRLIRELAAALLTPSENDTAIQTGPVVLEDIYFLWSVRHEEELAWFNFELRQLLADFDKAYQIKSSSMPRLHIQYYITGGSTTDAGTPIEKYDDLSLAAIPKMNDRSEPSTVVPTVFHKQHINARCLITDLYKPESSFGLYVCGPAGFNASFKNAVAGTKHNSQLLLHCEDFEI
ncbi:uncharacterized protein BYT42DRAFT_581850 [Radiomyces spectabilis]|uniref:uncharacterized protein n=1 Tax=Radiomyces spectabilis TaxID=64574 RepID=UPI002220D866|nr:uncharacterized protein BYT42DRAFT_581850 [Radiomyces spectabilis]KAI8370329.1 hypothetical protein BYT42DRAFT_581850 [Radiomyces spectabilis]